MSEPAVRREIAQRVRGQEATPSPPTPRCEDCGHASCPGDCDDCPKCADEAADKASAASAEWDRVNERALEHVRELRDNGRCGPGGTFLTRAQRLRQLRRTLEDPKAPQFPAVVEAATEALRHLEATT